VGLFVGFDFQAWLDDWAPLAEWAVALGTIILAFVTFLLSRQAKGEVKAVREQMETALRPVVFPVTPADWAMGGGVMTARRKRLLPVANGGPGVALNVRGCVMRRRDRGGVDEALLVAGSIGPGAEQDARLEPYWDGWDGTIGYLRYADLHDDEWITDFTCSAGDGDRDVSISAAPPRRAGTPDPDYPPPEWSEPPNRT
jgi:hypothetical protein